jgi:hypothetical protein
MFLSVSQQCPPVGAIILDKRENSAGDAAGASREIFRSVGLCENVIVTRARWLRAEFYA